jgi:hypothetical protein
MIIINAYFGLLKFHSTFTLFYKKLKHQNIMKTSFKLRSLLVIAFAFFMAAGAMAQDKKMEKKPKKPLSPKDSIAATIKSGATISIVYCRPSVRGRKIWDGLVPYGKVWRTGANEATRFTTDKAIMVEGKELPAGTYGFFAIPTANQWTIIFNSVANQWGAFTYDANKDVLRVMVTPVPAGKHNKLIYKIKDDHFELDWANLSVPVKIN